MINDEIDRDRLGERRRLRAFEDDRLDHRGNPPTLDAFYGSRGGLMLLEEMRKRERDRDDDRECQRCRDYQRRAHAAEDKNRRLESELEKLKERMKEKEVRDLQDTVKELKAKLEAASPSRGFGFQSRCGIHRNESMGLVKLYLGSLIHAQNIMILRFGMIKRPQNFLYVFGTTPYILSAPVAMREMMMGICQPHKLHQYIRIPAGILYEEESRP